LFIKENTLYTYYYKLATTRCCSKRYLTEEKVKGKRFAE